ncbi:uncharacterized protein [Rutidosis leptorrhynchoides]|uniref:uncharacterized protein n=1 Tax=Rutidosis leptorrhynchoides TaxID=125765 RepID=UPI003A99D7D7
MYQAHLNVEWCNQVGSIRNLFKYINKGNDKITAQLCDQETNEIKEYYDCRYVSSCEVMWRIFSFDIHHHSPSVIRLPFHLEGEQQIIFDEDEVIEDVVEKPSVNTSMFLEWMKCNVVNQEARSLTYVDFPTKFIWDKSNRVWRLRKNKTGAIGQIHHVAPASGDLFYLRILLNKVKGPTSYQDILKVDGILFDNFKDACYHLGLLDDDNEYIEAIKEAFFGEGGHFVRNLFAQLLLNNIMSRPEDVFDKTFEFLSVDVVHPNRPGTQIRIELLKDLTLQEIERLLQRNGSSLRSFSSMPVPSYNIRNISENHLIIDELSYDKSTLEVEHSHFITKLTTEQKDAYHKIIKSVEEGMGAVFFLYGYGGTGKTFLWKTLTAALRSQGEIVLNVATSGIAALLLSGDIGNGNVGESEEGVFDIEVPEDLLITDFVDPIGSMISTVYPEYLLNLSNPQYYQQRAILAPTHEVVDIINDRMMHCLEGEERSYLSWDSICASQRDTDFNSELYNIDFLNSIEVGGLPKHNLRLKVGVPVMLLRNVDQAGEETSLATTTLGHH